MNTLKVKYTLRDQFGSIFWAAVWIIGLMFLSNFLKGHGIEARQESMRDYYYSEGNPEDYVLWFVGQWACVVVSFLIFSSPFTSLFTGEGTLTANDQGHWNSMTDRWHRIFYGGGSNATTPFDEITRVMVVQSFFGRMFNTGDVCVTMIKYLGHEQDEFTWTFNGVENPHKVKEEILAQIPPSERVSLHV